MSIDKLTIAIPTYNRSALLRECLESIVHQRIDGVNIFISDNASTDGSADMVRAEFADAQVIANEENLGFAKANNQALRIARGEFLLLLNSDAFLQEHTVERLIAHLRSHLGGAAAGPKVLNMDGTLQSKGFVFPSLLWVGLELIRAPKLVSERWKTLLMPRYYWGENTGRKVD